MKNEQRQKLILEITEFLNSAIQISNDSDNKLSTHQVFYNDDTLRLKDTGNSLMKLYFEHQTYDMNGHRLTANNLVKLAKHLTSPYHVNSKKFTLYSEENSIMFDLAGDFSTWIQVI